MLGESGYQRCGAAGERPLKPDSCCLGDAIDESGATRFGQYRGWLAIPLQGLVNDGGGPGRSLSSEASRPCQLWAATVSYAPCNPKAVAVVF